MRDEDFDQFIAEFGEPTFSSPPPQTALIDWAGKIPNQWITYWQSEGWSSYANGLLWTVNPADYTDLVEEWLEDTPLENVDHFHVTARSAFGNLYLCGEKCGQSVTLCCAINAIVCIPKDLREKSNEAKDWTVKSFLGASAMLDFDMKDSKRQPLFKRALNKLGPLAADEMYGFEPALILGGQASIEHLSKVKLDQHLSTLRQLGIPTMPRIAMTPG